MLGVQGGPDAAAAVVAGDDDVAHPEHLDGVLEDREAVQIRGGDDVAHVAVDEEFAGFEPDDLVGGHPAVGAADPEVLGLVLVGQPPEETGVLRGDGRGPRPVVVEEVLESSHSSPRALHRQRS